MQSRRISPYVALVFALLCGCGQRPVDRSSSEEPAADQVAVEEVHFRHGDNLLAGTLYHPALPGQRPAVALVLGSGAQNRDCGGVGPALGRHFARHGFVCLAWDKPGVGQSTGDFNQQTFHDRAGEALAAVGFLRGRPEVRADEVGLWSHSQGGVVAPLAAAMSDQVAFVIQVSGWQGPAWAQDAVRVEAELRARGYAQSDIEKATAFARMRMDLIRKKGRFEELEEAQSKAKMHAWFKSVHWCDRTLFEWAKRNVDYDSAPSWEKVRCPVLIIYGDADTSTGPAEPLVAIIQRGLKKANNKDVTTHIFPGADHSLCSPVRDKTAYAEAPRKPDDPDFVPGYLELLTNWLGARFPSEK